MSFIRKYKKNGKTYLAEVENKKIDGKVVQRFIRHIGKEVDGNKILSISISNVEIDEVKIYGPLLILNKLAEELNLKDHLGEYSNEIMALVYAHCIDPKSINKMEDWFSKTDLNFLLDLDVLTEKRLLNALDSLTKIDPESFNEKIYNIAKKKYKLNGGGVIYDVTNTYLYGKKCVLGKYGKDKRGIKGSKLIQIGLGVTKDEGFPVFHKIFDGNVADAKTLKDVINLFSKLDVEKGIIIFDRGISSEENVKELKEWGWHSICGLKSTRTLKKLINNKIKIDELMNIKNRVKTKNSVFYVSVIKHKMGKISGILAICFNEKKAREIRESRYDEISNAKIAIKSDEAIKDGMEKYFWKNGSIKHDVLEEEEKMDGISFIFCTQNMKKEDIIRMYFTDKDIVEKAFQCLKGVTQVRPIRHWLYDRVKAHVFICYLSYLLLSALKIKISKLELSPIQALEDLNTMFKVYMKDYKTGMKFSRIVTLSKHQENILKVVDKKFLNIAR